MTISPVPTADSGERSLPVRLALALTESAAAASSNGATRIWAPLSTAAVISEFNKSVQNEFKLMAPVVTPLVSASRSSSLGSPEIAIAIDTVLGIRVLNGVTSSRTVTPSCA